MGNFLARLFHKRAADRYRVKRNYLTRDEGIVVLANDMVRPDARRRRSSLHNYAVVDTCYAAPTHNVQYSKLVASVGGRVTLVPVRVGRRAVPILIPEELLERVPGD